MATRNSTRHEIFGDSSELPTNVLPTNIQVGKHFLHLKTRPNESNKTIFKVVAQDVMAVWVKASIPTIQMQSVAKRVEILITTGSQLCRSKSSSNQMTTFKCSLNHLFDIAACNCLISINEATKEASSSCNCPRESKVPVLEQLFLFDQRTSRTMYIGVVDPVTTTTLQKRLKRKIDDQRRVEASQQKADDCSKSQRHTSVGSETDSSDKDEEEDELIASDSDFISTDKNETSQMRIPLPNLAKEADRYGISDRATASLATAVLIDIGIVTKEDKSLVIDKNKVRRERFKFRKSLKNDPGQSEEEDKITSIYFDGRRDKTLVKVKKNDKWHGDLVVEDHYVLVVEPGGRYLTHISPASGKSVDISNSIMAVVADQGLHDTIYAVGCDSTNANTGCHAGVIRQMELSLGRPLSWFICMLHTNELPLRHLFVQLDGATLGANCFRGPIGKALQNCESMPVVKFQRIASTNSIPIINDNVLDDLSSDQMYLYKIITAIRSGNVPVDLSSAKPGVLNHSRWITLANRVCRLYIATMKPSANLQVITHFIISNYGPNWFGIKRAQSCTEGAKHVYQSTQYLKELSCETASVVKPYISRSAYFAHSENMLLAMLADSDDGKRCRAVDMILQCRSKSKVKSPIRQFRVPEIRYDASDYVNLIDWSDVSEPPVTMKLVDEEIIQIKDIPLILQYPNHTQCVERCIKLVTEASSAVYGFDSRDGFIRARIKSRSLMPQFESKQDYSDNFLCTE